MKVELTKHQCDVIAEAFGFALQQFPVLQRVPISCNEYAPILQSLQAAQLSVTEQTKTSEI